MKLYYKIGIVVISAIILVIGWITLIVNQQLNASLITQMGNAAMDMSHLIAEMPQIKEGLRQKEQDGHIQELVEALRKQTRYQYMIVMDMEGIQYAYPYESGLYKAYKNGGEKRVLSTGEAYSSTDDNQWISAIRAFTPVYYEDKQVGAVLVGLLTDQVQQENETHRRILELALVISVTVGLGGAVYLAYSIKRSMFGLEPREIALLLSERDAIFQSIERGLIAIDTTGRILLMNQKAQLMLDLHDVEEQSNLETSCKQLYDLVMSVLLHGKERVNERIQLKNKDRFLVACCVMKNAKGSQIGAVVSLENLTQVRALAEEITDYRRLVDTLRAQNHEFMNKLQTISGLIQLGELEEVLDYVEDLSHKNSQLNHLLSEHIRDNQIAGLLLAKYAYISEKKVQLSIRGESHVDGLPVGLSSEDACTIIGNLLDNSLEILQDHEQQHICITINSNQEKFKLTVYNSGPAITPEIEESLFIKGFSTKGEGRGFGLFLVKQVVEQVGGKISWQNLEGVIWHVVIPNDEDFGG
jgi:two-component system, CitB family, sensor kinase